MVERKGSDRELLPAWVENELNNSEDNLDVIQISNVANASADKEYAKVDVHRMVSHYRRVHAKTSHPSSEDNIHD